MKIVVNFGKNLKKYRKKCNYTQEKLAELANVSVTYLSLLENGKGNTTLLQVEVFAKLLKVDYLTLLEKNQDSYKK